MLRRRRDLLGVWVGHDTWISVDLKSLDPRLAISLTLILGPVFVVTVVILAISLSDMARAAESVSNQPMPFQESPRSRRNIVATLIVLHLLVIHRVDNGHLRAYGLVAYGAATGRTKPSEALLLWPT